MPLRRLALVPVLVALMAPLVGFEAAGAAGLPHQDFIVGLDGTTADAISGLSRINIAGGDGIALTDAVGARRLTHTGDALYTADGNGAAAEDLLVDSSGTGFATFVGDSKLHVLAPDGHELRTVDFSGYFGGPVQLSGLTLDSGPSDSGFARTLYVQSDDGLLVVDPDNATFDPTVDGVAALSTISGPGLLAVAPDHSLFAVTGTNRITHYTDEGIKLSSFQVASDVSNAPNPPAIAGIAIDSKGVLFASDNANNRVVELTLDGTVLDQFGEPNPQAGFVPASATPGALDGPGPLVIDCRGRLWVADTDSTNKSRLVAFTHVAAPTGSCSTDPAPVTAIVNSDQASAIAVDRAGNTYDSAMGQVKKYDAAGKFVLAWGTDHPVLGSGGDAAFGFPSGIATDPVNGDVWVDAYRWPTYDSAGNVVGVVNGDPKLLRFSPTGVLRAHITTPAGGSAFNQPGAITVRTSDGHVFVADPTLGTIQELDRSGAFVRSFAVQQVAGGLPAFSPIPLALAFDHTGNLLVSVQQRAGSVSGYGWNVGGVERFAPTGSFVDTAPVPQNFPTADPPRSMAVRPDGSMLWSTFAFLPGTSGNTTASVLTVTSTLKATGDVLTGTIGSSTSDRLAVDCRGNVRVADVENSRFFTLRYASGRCTWLPTATTGAVASRTRTSLTVKGSANPSAQVTKMRVLYGTTTKYGKTTAWVTLPSDNITATKSFVLSGLLHAHTYHYKVQVQNASGRANGKDRTGSTS